MEKEIVIEIIRIAPNFLLYLALLIIFLRYRKSFIEGILPKLNAFKAFGIELSFIEQGIEKAARSVNKTEVQASPSLMRRIKSYQKRPLRILWTDDNPDTVMYESSVLQNLGFMVEFAKTTQNAMEKIKKEKFDLLISDISRNQNPTEGLQMLQLMAESQASPPVIFYIAQLDHTKGVPIGAFGITDDPNELVHLVLDAAERAD